MRLLRDNYFIESDADLAYKLKGTTLDLWTDPDYNKGFTHNAVVSGIVRILPISIQPRKKVRHANGHDHIEGFYNHTPLVEGDKVYVHHNVVDKRHERRMDDGTKLYLCPHFQVIAVVREGVVIPLQDWVLSTPVMEPEENFCKMIGGKEFYLKPERERMKNQLQAKFLSLPALEEGLSEGDIFHHHNDADYEIIIEGETLYRTSIKHINGIVNKL